MSLSCIRCVVPCFFLIAISQISGTAQTPFKYFSTDIEFNSIVPAPNEVLEFEVGNWHVSHDKLVRYFEELASSSDRVKLIEYGRSHEGRKLFVCAISSPENIERLTEIQTTHLTSVGGGVRSDKLILYQGFSIHGNEASGSNAAMLYGYYLAANLDVGISDKLNETIILLDPCLNPDGLNRFASWVNMHKSMHLNTDAHDREFHEVWPGGRTNHYWFDLNRDWLLLVHPESQGRVDFFHKWKPHVLTDHHEMGSHSTFFFMPGVQSRINPETPKENQRLTADLGVHHAEYLDSLGRLYFSGERFDDFYIGKGSTFPDVNGCVGILFEQASARGHAQQTVHGVLTFKEAIQNQLTTSLSTLNGSIGLKDGFIDFQRAFYQTSRSEAKKGDVQGYLCQSVSDKSKMNTFIQWLKNQHVDAFRIEQNTRIDGIEFQKEYSVFIPADQMQYRFLKAAFEPFTSFDDSLFYDVSAWSIPMAFGLDFKMLDGGGVRELELGAAVELNESKTVQMMDHAEAYGYLIDWSDSKSAKWLYEFLKNNIKVKVATKPFEVMTHAGKKEFKRGTLMIPIGIQESKRKLISNLIDRLNTTQIPCFVLKSGSSTKGPNMGSGHFSMIRKPKMAMLVGPGVSAYDAGEIWHLFDSELQIPITKLNISDLNASSARSYNVLVMPNGSYSGLTKSQAETIKAWVLQGNTLVCIKGAASWAESQKLISLQTRKSDHAKTDSILAYGTVNSRDGAMRIGGCILNAKLDLTHPITYGYHRTELPIFKRGTMFVDPPKNPYATPVRYADNPLLSGYLHKDHQAMAPNAAGVVVHRSGRGRILSYLSNPVFRGYWRGTKGLLVNGVYFSNLIDGRTCASSD